MQYFYIYYGICEILTLQCNLLFAVITFVISCGFNCSLTISSFTIKRIESVLYSGHLNDKCRSHDDCRSINNATCHLGTCMCAKGFLPMSAVQCAPSSYLRSPCVSDSQCHVSGGTCVAGVCSCQPTLVPFSRSRCGRAITYCRTSADCSQAVAGSVCQDGKCTTDDSHIVALLVAAICVLCIILLTIITVCVWRVRLLYQLG
jgi:hypothetical protein